MLTWPAPSVFAAAPVSLVCVRTQCPLLAVCNVLLLRGAIKLRADLTSIAAGDLVQLVGNYLLEANSKVRVWPCGYMMCVHQHVWRSRSWHAGREPLTQTAKRTSWPPSK